MVQEIRKNRTEISYMKNIVMTLKPQEHLGGMIVTFVYIVTRKFGESLTIVNRAFLEQSYDLLTKAKEYERMLYGLT